MQTTFTTCRQSVPTATDVFYENFSVSISLSPLLREHSLLLCKREPAEGLESAARWSLNCQNNRSIPCSQLRPSNEIVETGSFSNSIFCPAFSHPSFFLRDNDQVWLDRALLPLNRQTFSHRWAADHIPTTPSSQGCYVSPWNYIFWRLKLWVKNIVKPPPSEIFSAGASLPESSGSNPP